jgi:hypothetical protein
MGKHNFDEINWEETGFLYGQQGLHKERLLEYLNKIDFNDESLQIQFLAPCIRKIILDICDVLYIVNKNDITDENQQFYLLNNINEEIFDKINVKEITVLLNEFVTVYLPISMKYLGNIDFQAELLDLFCVNYVRSVISKIN